MAGSSEVLSWLGQDAFDTDGDKTGSIEKIDPGGRRSHGPVGL